MVNIGSGNPNSPTDLSGQSGGITPILGPRASSALTKVALRATFVAAAIFTATQFEFSVPAALAMVAVGSLPSLTLAGAGFFLYQGTHVMEAARWIGAAERIVTSLEEAGSLAGKWVKLLPIKEIVSGIHAAQAGNCYTFLIGAGLCAAAFLAFQLHDHPSLPYRGPMERAFTKLSDWIAGVAQAPPSS